MVEQGVKQSIETATAACREYVTAHAAGGEAKRHVCGTGTQEKAN